MEVDFPGKAAATALAKTAAAQAKAAKAAATLERQDAAAEVKALATAAYAAKSPAKSLSKDNAHEAKYPGKLAAATAARAARAKPKGGSRPRRAKLKINNSNLLMPFHDIADDQIGRAHV